MSEMAKLRTIDQAYKYIKQIDPDSAISRNYIRNLVLGGYISYVAVGAKRLINVDELFSYIQANTKNMKERQSEKV